MCCIKNKAPIGTAPRLINGVHALSKLLNDACGPVEQNSVSVWIVLTAHCTAARSSQHFTLRSWQRLWNKNLLIGFSGYQATVISKANAKLLWYPQLAVKPYPLAQDSLPECRQGALLQWQIVVDMPSTIASHQLTVQCPGLWLPDKAECAWAWSGRPLFLPDWDCLPCCDPIAVNI